MADQLNPYRQHLSFLANFITEYLYIPEYKAETNPVDANGDQDAKDPDNADPQNTDTKAVEPKYALEVTPVYEANPHTMENQSKGDEQAVTPNHYGGFQDGIVLLVNYPASTELIRKDELVLQRILKAVGLSFEDVAVINLGRYPDLTFEELLKTYPARVVVGFDVATDYFPEQPERYKPLALNNGPQVLAADRVAEIATKKTLKKQLWESLKSLFNLT